MKDVGKVHGSAEQALPLVVGKDTVYIHTDIEKVEFELDGVKIEDLYSYNEKQYTKDEYIKLLSDEKDRLNDELTNAQLALCDLFEKKEG